MTSISPIEPVKINIVMAGSTGVGKTSMLAAMYPSLREQLHNIRYNFVPQDEDHLVLTNEYEKLQKLAQGGIEVVSDYVGTRGEKEFVFHIQPRTSESPDMELHLWDLPGGFYQDKQATRFLNDSNVSFLCVDAVTLMERCGIYHNRINMPDEIKDCYLKSNLHPNHIIIVCLMRAETYEQDGLRKKLFQTFDEKYSTILSEIKKQKNTNIFVGSIQTTGRLRYNKIEVTGSDIKSYFIRHQNIKDYFSKGCDTPIQVAIHHSLATVKSTDIDNMKLIKKDYPPFTRFLWFMSGYKEYWERVARAKRLSLLLKEMEKSINIQSNQSQENCTFFQYHPLTTH